MKLSADTLAPTAHPVARLPAEWEECVVAWGEPRYRGKQIFDWIHRQGILDPDEMSNVPKRLRERLKEEGLGWPIHIVSTHESADRTKKFLVGMPDGEMVETVLIPQLGDERVVTQCISSQVGCAMGCVFCASGVAGLKRQMTDAEIVAQVLLGRRELGPDQRIRNVVFMGMGEPLHNYDAVARALVLLTHPDGLDLSKRRVTVSTSGLVKQIDRLGRDFDGQVQLAISLHAVRDEERSKIMPVNRKHGLGELTEALRRYPLSKRQRITIEYTLIEGVNDSVRDANGLVELLRGIPIKVNLIPMNPISASDLRAPDTSHVTRFQEQLTRRGLSVFIRKTRGDDVAAACGQLAFHGSPRRTGRGALAADSD
ncbi:MAG: 23S rRNA (adenine(2503)-C(2))-methyltransferase RlmN [Myxococcales bacterium]|nr:23S rRNA (adenine(2503)-C(2))-methyltransferase RlmN [Myxococcales bacterium]